MKDIQFPLFKTKVENSPRFDLSSAEQRQEYFELKAGGEIKQLKEYLKENSFIAYMLGKKSSGKGTYAKMFREIVAPDKVEHLSIGDMIRELDEVVRDKKKKQQFLRELSKNYRGYISLDEIVKALEERSTKILLPSELILALVKMKISQQEKKALFIDGFPRGLDQISYSLFFRDLIGYRDDPDVFVLIDVPEKVIDERIKHRVVCPVCQTSRNLKLLPTKKVGFDKEKQTFYLICDNPECKTAKARMTGKEGDEFGIEPIRDRLNTDEELIKKAFKLYGIPKVLLRNAVPAAEAKDYVDDYEITPEFAYQIKGNGGIETIEKPWQIQDDAGELSYSLMPPAIVVSLIKQLVEALDI